MAGHLKMALLSVKTVLLFYIADSLVNNAKHFKYFWTYNKLCQFVPTRHPQLRDFRNNPARVGLIHTVSVSISQILLKISPR